MPSATCSSNEIHTKPATPQGSAHPAHQRENLEDMSASAVPHRGAARGYLQNPDVYHKLPQAGRQSEYDYRYRQEALVN